jgi:hypothetical protein
LLEEKKCIITMECKPCKFKCTLEKDLQRHKNTDKHRSIIEMYEEFQKKLEEANLEKELSIRREQKLKEVNLALIQREERLKQEIHEINLKFLNEKRNRTEKTSFENTSKSTSGLDLSFKSNFSWNSIKTIDSNINNLLSIEDHNSLAKMGKQMSDLISQEFSIENNIKDDKCDKNKDHNDILNDYDLKESYKGDNDINKSISGNCDIEVEEKKNNKLDNIDNDDIYESNYPYDIETQTKNIFVKYRFKFFDFDNNQSIKISNRSLFVLVKKIDVVHSQLFKYMCYLKSHMHCDIKFYDEETFYLLSCRFKHRHRIIFRKNFYFTNIKIPANDIFVATIDKNKIKDFIKLFKPLESSISDSVTSDFIGKLFKNSDKTDKETIKSIEILLQESLKSLGIDFINEYGCAVNMVPIYLGFSKYNASKNLKNGIYSLEKYMRVDKVSRKCDAIYIYENVIFIIEYKMNVHHEQHALDYISDRYYVKHLLKYLLAYEGTVLEGIDLIGQIGILFYKDKAKIEVGENLKIEELKKEIGTVDVNLKIYKKKFKQRRPTMTKKPVKLKLFNHNKYLKNSS